MTFMNIEECAEFLRISRSKLYKLVEAEGIPHVKLGRRILFNPDRLREWLASKEVKSL